MKVTITNSIIVYFITWWVVLFMVLPIGIKQDHAPIAGNEVGAPKNPNMKQKLILVTIITTILFGVYIAVMLWS